MWFSLLDALFTGLAVFIALELHTKVAKVREIYGGRLPLKEIVKPYSNLLEKTEMLPPMDYEEYEQHMLDQSDRGELLKKVLGKLPWTSKGKNSQSSDS